MPRDLEKLREYHREYYERNQEVLREKHRERRERNRDDIAEQKREYFARNREYFNCQHRKWNHTRKDMVENPRTGPYTPAEDAILLRTDLSRTQQAFMLQRSYNSVISRVGKLRRQGTMP